MGNLIRLYRGLIIVGLSPRFENRCPMSENPTKTQLLKTLFLRGFRGGLIKKANLIRL